MNLKKLGKIFHDTVEAHLMDTPLIWPLYSGLNKNLVIFLFKKPLKTTTILIWPDFCGLSVIRLTWFTFTSFVTSHLYTTTNQECRSSDLFTLVLEREGLLVV